jgi:hypothetical protein
MEELNRLIWVLSRPTCSKINSLMHNVIGVQLSTSEQHLELNNSIKKRDNADIHTLINYLRPHIPFIGGHNNLKILQLECYLLVVLTFMKPKK